MPITDEDLKELTGFAQSHFVAFPSGKKLPGMDGALDLRGQVALSWYEAVLTLLNRQGALASGWLEQNRVQLEAADSEPEADE